MIQIVISAEGEVVTDNFKHKNTTLIENSVVLRRLEEIKKKLLDFEYESKFEVSEDLK